MSKEPEYEDRHTHPYEERAKGLIGTPGPTHIGPGHYPDGQEQHGVPLKNIHRGEKPDYLSRDGHKHREDLRGAPPAPIQHKTPPPEARPIGNLHEHMRKARGKRK